ncbi:MAG: hypothetical protein ABSG43_30150 [Solirubrobacteraceae bacterium]|jgi:hypothetical protein
MTPYRHQLLAATALAALLAGCGGSNSPSSSTSSNSGDHAPSAQPLQAVLNFTTCVRSHGVPNIPDPGTPEWKNALGSQAPAVLAAERICGRLVPGAMPPSQNESEPHSPAQTAAMLAFARCLRSHGFPNFPDPISSGQLTHQMIATAGINLQQPAVLQAGDACVSVTHGLITKTAVARFVAGQ